MAPKRNVTDYYRLEKRVCKTTSGTINLVKKIDTGKQFAMKMMKKNILIPSLKNLGLSSTTHEADILQTLDHPNIIKYEATYETDSVVYLITEYLEGGELYFEIDQGALHTEEEVRMATFQLLDAVNYLHSHSIAHRDIKLENIMLRKSKDITNLVLIDFGMAKKYDPNIKMTEFCGTINYIAPEMYYAADYDTSYDEKIDCWGIGIVLFTIMFRRFPVPFTLPQLEIKRRTMCDELDYPTDEECPFSEAALDLLRSLLRIDPDARPSCEEALNHPWFTGEPNSEVPPQSSNKNETIATASDSAVVTQDSLPRKECTCDNNSDSDSSKDTRESAIESAVHPTVDKKKLLVLPEVLLALPKSHSQQSSLQAKHSDGRVQSPKSSPVCKSLCIQTSPLDSSDELPAPC